MYFGRETAGLVLYRIMQAEGCNEWKPKRDGGAVIRYRAASGFVHYSRQVKPAECADTVANRVAGDSRRGE